MFSVRTSPRVSALLFLLAGLSLLPGRSFAYVTEDKHWTYNRTVVMNLSLGGSTALQDGFTSFNQSAADALNIWNNYLVHMRFRSIQGSTLPAADGDADNSAFFSSTVYGMSFGSGVLAITLITSRTDFTETDVLFNSARSWNSYRGPLQGNLMDFHRVALHEFGHVLGLDHPDEANQHVTAIMNSTISNIDSLQADDLAGAHSIYDTGPARLSSNPAPNLINLSTRALVGTGNNVLIGGFIVQGSQAATVILRAIGHSLAASGLSKPLTDPQIELRNSSGSLLAQNDDWVDSADAQNIASYGLDPTNSRESAILRTLTPGNYTAIVKAFDNGDGDLTGTGLFELYDLHTSGGRAGNISTRGQVGTGNDVMIAGFIIGGSQSKEVIVRALGPSLATAGISNPLSNPNLEVHDSNGSLLRSNDNWQSDPNSARVQQVGLAPNQPVESALDLNLNPGAYTAIVSGVSGATGIALVEVYDLSAAP